MNEGQQRGLTGLPRLPCPEARLAHVAADFNLCPEQVVSVEMWGGEVVAVQYRLLSQCSPYITPLWWVGRLAKKGFEL